ncbi:hypothetical protein ACLMAJ_36370 [Nocardia sp. KC 131]|uniref:hypothetical protein n=1 Tax=Nocardia arseniciresistens TaxID=3392119 RepID=UPI00398EDA01
MNEMNEDSHRGRRRAVRSAGPPVEENETFSESATPAESATPTEPVGTAGVTPPVAEIAATAAAGVKADSTSAEGGQVDLGKTRAETTKDADEEDASPQAAESKSRRTRILAAVACAVVAIAAVVGAGWSVMAMKSVDDRDARRTEYTQTARQAILNLTTIRADSAKEDIDRILSVASGQFKTEFDGRVDPFLNIVKEAKVVSNGEIVEAAVESDDENSAKILVAAKQTLTNAGQAEPQTRFYRFRVTVTRGDSGLSASNVEFVG